MPAPIAELLRAYPRGSALLVAGMTTAALLWHLCLPGFLYQQGPGIYIDGPLPAVFGVAIALWFWRDSPPLLQALVACAWALLGLLASVVVFGTLARGPWHSAAAVWGELRQGFRLPFSAVVDLWDSPYFAYSFWPALRPLMLWGTVAFVVLLLRQEGSSGTGPLRGLVGGFSERWAFNAAQRRQMKDYRATYLAAVRGGETPPPPPTGLMPASGSPHELATAHLVLKIGLAVAGALGLIGGGWAVAGDVLKGPIGAIFARGLVGG